jgi:hypothetical protein
MSWRMTFVNQYGLTFTTDETELNNVPILTYIEDCLNANSVLVKLEVVK